MSTNKFNRFVATLVAAMLVTVQVPVTGARAATRGTPPPAHAPINLAANDHFLRDAIPAVIASTEPPDTIAEPPDTTEDEFFLPPEQDRKKLIRDITAFVIASAFIAYFIVKVFIEKDNTPPPTTPGGKGIPPPR